MGKHEYVVTTFFFKKKKKIATLLVFFLQLSITVDSYYFHFKQELTLLECLEINFSNNRMDALVQNLLSVKLCV